MIVKAKNVSKNKNDCIYRLESDSKVRQYLSQRYKNLNKVIIIKSFQNHCLRVDLAPNYRKLLLINTI